MSISNILEFTRSSSSSTDRGFSVEDMHQDGYLAVADEETNSHDDSIGEKYLWRSITAHNRLQNWALRFSLLLFVLSCLSIVATSLVIFLLVRNNTQLSSRICTSPPIRREWRSLMPSERASYIRAVQCLIDTPSTLKGQGSLYDDFVYVHMYAGWKSHDAASFLPRHRAFLHIYESTLSEKCSYKGVTPYWSWEFDWQDLANSSIWDETEGFGRDGNQHSELTPGDGRCLSDGPFNHSQRLYFDGEVQPHCLGRAFIHHDTEQHGSLAGDWFRPERMGLLKRARGFNQFREMIEGTAHNALHWGIRGDFSSISAANDPIFWLHHAQLDRLWWQWQQENYGKRHTEYYGKAFNTTEGSRRQGTLDDKLSFLGLWEDIAVSEVMSTDRGLLCYRY